MTKLQKLKNEKSAKYVLYNKIHQFIGDHLAASIMLSFVKNQKGGQNLVDTSGYQYRINKMEAAKDIHTI